MSSLPLTVARVVHRLIALGNELNIILQTPKTFENGRQALADETSTLLNSFGDASDEFVDEVGSYYCIMPYVVRHLCVDEQSYLYICNTHDLWVKEYKELHEEKIATLPPLFSLVPAFPLATQPSRPIPVIPAFPPAPQSSNPASALKTPPPYAVDPPAAQVQLPILGVETKMPKSLDGDSAMKDLDDPATGPTPRQSLVSVSGDEVADSDAEAEGQATDVGADVPQGRGLPPAPVAGPMPVGPCKPCFVAGIDCLGSYIRNGTRRRQTWALLCVHCAANKKKCVKYVMDDLPLARAQRPQFAIPTPTEDANFVARPQAQRKMTQRLSESVKKGKSHVHTDNGPIPVASGSRPCAQQSCIADGTASGSGVGHNDKADSSGQPRRAPYPDLLQLLSNLQTTLAHSQSVDRPHPVNSFTATKILVSMSRHALLQDDSEYFEAYSSAALETDFPDYFPDLRHPDNDEEEEAGDDEDGDDEDGDAEDVDGEVGYGED